MTTDEMIQKELQYVPRDKFEEFKELAKQLVDPAAEISCLSKVFRLGFTDEQIQEVMKCSGIALGMGNKICEISWRSVK